MSKTLPLDGQWHLYFCPDGSGDPQAILSSRNIEWLPARVPGLAHLDLFAAGRIEDPFFETNTRNLRYLEKQECWYRTVFRLPPDFARDRVELEFDGLDTFAAIWLNGIQAGRHANMFTPLCLDVTKHLRAGADNVLLLRLASPIAAVRDLDLTGCSAAFDTTERLWARKAQEGYGWDIAPRIVTAGIWRPVRIIARDRAALRDVHFTCKLRKASALLRFHIEIEDFTGAKPPLSVTVQGAHADQKFQASAEVSGPSASLELTLRRPRLWWPWDLGEPALYDATVTLAAGHQVLDRKHMRLGLRQVRLLQPKDERGRAFYFEINDKPAFARGLNWTPADALYPRAQGQRHRLLLDMTRAMNANMLRVWGGGVYEPDAFYQRCSELGIMVWQDFMFACAVYPQAAGFLAQVQQEAETTVRRLRNFPCLVLWSGDNEVDSCYPDQGAGRGKGRWSNRINREVLPEVCRRLDPSRPYIPSSPFSPSPKKPPGDQDAGDNHIWHHGTPFRDPVYSHDRSRFVSEIGHLSAPALSTLRSFLSPENLWPRFNETWDHHFGSHRDLGFHPERRLRLDEALERHFGEVPGDLDTYVLASQLLQGEAYKFWAEHCRRQKFECGGILLWNVADCWPQFSDAVVDFFLNPKLACAFVRWAFEPVHLFFHREGDRLTLWVANDTLQPLAGEISAEARVRKGTLVGHHTTRAPIPANAATEVADLSELLSLSRPDGTLTAILQIGGQTISRNLYRLAKPRLRSLPQLLSEVPPF